MAKVNKKMAMFHLGQKIEKCRSNMYDALWVHNSVRAYDIISSELTGVLHAYIMAGIIDGPEFDEFYEELRTDFWDAFESKREEIADYA